MARKKQENVDPDGPPSYEDSITDKVSLRVEGRNLAEILDRAKVEAARALETQPINIYIVSNSGLVEAATARFEPDGPILWSAYVTCGVVPLNLRM